MICFSWFVSFILFSPGFTHSVYFVSGLKGLQNYYRIILNLQVTIEGFTELLQNYAESLGHKEFTNSVYFDLGSKGLQNYHRIMSNLQVTENLLFLFSSFLDEGFTELLHNYVESLGHKEFTNSVYFILGSKCLQNHYRIMLNLQVTKSLLILFTLFIFHKQFNFLIRLKIV